MNCWLDPMMWSVCAGVAAGNAAVDIASIPDGIAHSFGSAASSAVTWLWQQVSDATTIDLTTPGIGDDLAITAGIAAVITMALFCIQVIGSALRGSFAGLGRSVRGLLIAFAGAVFAIAATQLTLTAVDDLANGVVQATTDQNLSQIGASLVAVSSLGLLGWAGLLLMSLALLLAVAVIWCALMIRKMLIVVAAVLAPIAFSGSTADITKGWARKWIEFTVALIFSKLILVVIVLVGLSMADGAGATGSTTNQITNLAIGTLTLLLAGFAPWLAIRMVHFTGDAFHQVHAQAGAAGAGAAMAAAAPQKAAAVVGGATRAFGSAGLAKPAALGATSKPAAPGATQVAGVQAAGSEMSRPDVKHDRETAAAKTGVPAPAATTSTQAGGGVRQTRATPSSSGRIAAAETAASPDGSSTHIALGHGGSAARSGGTGSSTRVDRAPRTDRPFTASPPGRSTVADATAQADHRRTASTPGAARNPTQNTVAPSPRPIPEPPPPRPTSPPRSAGNASGTIDAPDRRSAS